jgi:hypothetical protein
VPKFKGLLPESSPGKVYNPYAAYRLDEKENKVWLEGETDIEFLDIHFSDLLPTKVPKVAKERLDLIKARIDQNHGGSEGLKKLFDKLSADGVI